MIVNPVHIAVAKRLKFRYSELVLQIEEVRGALEAVLLPRVGAEDATAIARTLVVCNDVSSATPAYRTCKSLRPVSRASCIGGGGAGTTDS